MKPMAVFRYLVSIAWVLALLLLARGGWQGTFLPASYAASNAVQAVACWDCLKAIDPVVIQDEGIFKMWYTGVGLDKQARIGYATSPDGVTWTKHPGNPMLDLGSSDSWDKSWVRVNAVIKQGGTYHMWYTSGGAVGYATSSDGITWNKHPGNPVFTKGPDGSWDGRFIVHIDVFPDSATYKMWYTGIDAGGAGRIGYAESPDGINWTRQPSPVLDVGPAGSWEGAWVFDPSVLQLDGGYRMWYSGIDSMADTIYNAKIRIGYATSDDGINWAKHPDNPVLDIDPAGWDRQTVTAPWVLYDGTIYHMWYHGGTPGVDAPEMIGYATSSDGITWTKHPGNPVLRKSE